MKKLLTIATLLLGMAGFASDGNAFKYYVPLPEKTFSGEWQYLIEAGIQGEGEHRIQITGYNILGMKMAQYEDIFIDGSGGFTFSPFGEQQSKGAAIQSLTISSDTEIQGFMWIYNDETGQVNAVSINLEQKSNVIIPQIGTNYFTWKSGFSLMGIGPDSNSSNLDFRFYDSNGMPTETELWSNFKHQSFLKKTPYYDVFLGDLDNPISAYWGEVLCQNSEFSLAGYQSFARVDGSPQTCTFELNEPPKAKGSLPIFKFGDQTSHWVTFTNPHDFEITTRLTLFFEETYFEEEVETSVINEDSIEITIPPNGRVSGIIGQTWHKEVFFDETKTPLRFQFDIAEIKQTEGEPVVNNSIFALHFATDEQAALGAANIQSPGNTTSFWLSGQNDIERTILLQNAEKEPITTELSIISQDGKVVGHNSKVLAPSEIWTINENALRDLFSDPSETYYFSFTSKKGLFTTAMTGQRNTGLALITLPTKIILTEEPKGL